MYQTLMRVSDPYALFIYALNSPVTRERYSTRLRYFLNKIGLTSNDRDNKKSIADDFSTFRGQFFVEKDIRNYAFVDSTVYENLKKSDEEVELPVKNEEK
jgi:hypothetical protein